jgi:hypothetical protein
MRATEVCTTSGTPRSRAQARAMSARARVVGASAAVITHGNGAAASAMTGLGLEMAAGSEPGDATRFSSEGHGCLWAGEDMAQGAARVVARKKAGGGASPECPEKVFHPPPAWGLPRYCYTFNFYHRRDSRERDGGGRKRGKGAHVQSR